jgi:type VI secretion system protein ImpF
VTTSDKTGVSIEIDGLLVMSPAPERLVLRTLVDLESGRAQTSLREA